jgi:hypothetical protein
MNYEKRFMNYEKHVCLQNMSQVLIAECRPQYYECTTYVDNLVANFMRQHDVSRDFLFKKVISYLYTNNYVCIDS